MSQYLDIEALNQQVAIESAFLDTLIDQQKRILVGQQHMLDRMILGLLTNGHILLEGLPGLAKTLAIKTLAQSIDASFNRIQFTPDLLPADIIGTLIYNPSNQNFSVRKGPIFANFILADEINRAPAKVQSALLEAMQERQVTIGKETFLLDEPFLVLATQNPIEQEGTYPLPEAQTDRFMMKVIVDYPTPDEEREIMRRNLNDQIHEKVKAVIHPQDILKARNAVSKVYMDERIEKYIVQLVFATRRPENYGIKELSQWIQYGASPRASIFMAKASKAYAFMKHRGFVIPDDVQNVCRDILRHRIGLSYEAEAENINQDEIISRILSRVEVP
ncbi:MAG: AAA family ATPase [Saprospiraceae bacterium]|nr:AAA family ATPase [Saprospiraceae bacterium]MBK8448644.1 AAA family ATPase [Saprospiraceae bacterium]MBK8482853.1 AAA family ATPase [Saprospiraceae bacterium]MBK9722784.1 AAA family ATPase [Saprospiraceae bacterium]